MGLIGLRRALEPVLEAIGQAFQWWFEELRGMVPTVILYRLVPDRPSLILEFRENEVGLGRIVRGFYQPCGRVAEAELEHSQPAPLAAALAGFRPNRVELRLPKARILYQKVLLPLGRPSRLSALLRFELDRQTPFALNQVYYDACIIERDPIGKTMVAAVALVKRRDADRAIAVAQRWQLTPTRLAVQDDPRWSLDFRSVPVVGEPSRRRRHLASGMAAIALIFAFAAWQLHASAQDAYAEALDAELARSRPAAETVKVLQKELAEREARIAFLARRRKSASVGRLLEALATTLPDDTWITTFELDGPSVRFGGFSTETALLPTRLSDLPLLSNLQLSKGQERAGPGAAPFELSSELLDGAGP